MCSCSLALRAVPLVAALGAAVSGPARADDAQSVVVTAGRVSQQLTDAMPHTTVLSRTDIEQSQAVDLAALLASEAGVQLSSNGPRGTATSLFLRGAQARQVLVLVDGVPLSRQDATGQVGIEHLMLDQVDRIEIVRGNASALYGAGAIGGVIQIFTRSASATPQASLRFEGGSRGLLHGSARATQQWGATQLSLAASAERDRGYSALDAAQLPAANPDRDGYRNTSAAVHLSHTLSADHSLAAGWVHSDGTLDYDSRFSAPADTQRSRTRKNLVHVASDNAITSNWASRLRLSTQREISIDDTSGSYGYHADYRTTVDSLNWDNSVRLSPALTLNGGLDHQRQRIVADDGTGGTYQHTRTLTAVFAGVRARLATHELAVNLRRDRVGDTGSRSSGSLAWSWQIAPAWKTLASVANAFGVAPLGYLYAPYFGNATLKPELSRSAEVGLQWAVEKHRLRATLFRTRTTDEIEYDNATDAFANVARTRNRGLELSYNGQFGHTTLRGSLTSQHAVDDVSGARRLRRSDVLGSLALSHALGQGWRIGVALRHAGDRPDSGNVTLPAYTVADLTAQWDMRQDVQGFARIENVADVRYQTAQYYNQPARGLFAGLRWRLPL